MEWMDPPDSHGHVFLLFLATRYLHTSKKFAVARKGVVFVVVEGSDED